MNNNKPLDERQGQIVADPRTDARAYTDDEDVADVFDESQVKAVRPVRESLRQFSQPDVELAAGDPDVDLMDAEFVGEEAIGGQNPTPNQDVVDDIGLAVGLVYEDSEPLHTTSKLEKRDRERWELRPASSEDFGERLKTERGEWQKPTTL